MPKPGPLSGIESDPEFASFPPDVQARIRADAKASARKKPTGKPAPAKPSKAQGEVDQMATDRRRRAIGMPGEQLPPNLEDVARATGDAAIETARSGMTAAIVQGGADALAEPTRRALRENDERLRSPLERATAASPSARAIPKGGKPAPTLGQQAKGLASAIAEPIASAAQDVVQHGYANPLPGKNPTFALGAGAFVGSGAAALADPADPAAALAMVGASKVAQGLRTTFHARRRPAVETPPPAPPPAASPKTVDGYPVTFDAAGRPIAAPPDRTLPAREAPARPAAPARIDPIGREMPDRSLPARGLAARQAPGRSDPFAPVGDATPIARPMPDRAKPDTSLPFTTLPDRARPGTGLVGSGIPFVEKAVGAIPRLAAPSAAAPLEAERPIGLAGAQPLAAAPVVTDGPGRKLAGVASPRGIVPGRLKPGDPGFDPFTAPLPKGARVGSIRVGRPSGPGWDPAVKKANAALNASIKELQTQHAQALENGDLAAAVRIADEIQTLDDARVIADHRPRNPGNPVSVRAARYYNPTKYDFLSPQSADKYETALTNTVARMRAEGRDPRARVTQAQVLRDAEDINPFAVEQMARRGLRKGESLTAVEYEAAKNHLQELVEESIRTETRVNDLRMRQTAGNATPDEVLVAERELARLEHDTERLAEVVTQSRSQKGRDLAMLKMVAQQGWDVGYWRARAERVSGGAATTAQMRGLDAIVIRGEAARQAGDAAGIRQARIDLATAMGELERTAWPDAIIAMRKAGLLTGVKTMGRNVTSNTFKVLLDEATRALGALPDAGISMVSGRRTTFMPTPRKVGRALGEVRTRGIPEAQQTMLYGMPLDQLAAMEIPREINTPSRAFNTYVNAIFRFQGAQDRLFKAYALRRSLDDQARQLALDVARQPGPRPSRAAVQAYADRLSANPTEEMMREAIADAEMATFQQNTAVSEGIAGLKRGLRQAGAKEEGVGGMIIRQSGQNAARFLDVVVPYVKTPAAIADEIINMALWRDVGATAFARGQRLRGEARRRGGTIGPPGATQARRNTAPIESWTPSEQKAMARGISKGMIGSTIIWAGGQLYDRGLITGTSQMDRANEDQAAGRTPGSIKIGDQWIPLNPFSPMGNLLVLGASLARDGRDNPNFWIYHSWRTILDQPFTQGTKQLVDTLNPGKEGVGKSFNRFAGSVAGSMVPTLVSETAQALDPAEADREVDYATRDTAAAESIGKRLPTVPIVTEVANFLGVPTRQQLPVKPTALGDDVDAPAGWRSFAAGAGKYARENTDPVVREVLELGVSLPQKRGDVRLDDNSDPIPLTGGEAVALYRRTGELSRQAIADTIADPEYRQMTVEERVEEIQSELQDAAADALDEFLEANDTVLRARVVPPDRGRGRAVVAPMRQQ